MLWKYVKDHKLVPEKMPKNIMLDEALCTLVFSSYSLYFLLLTIRCWTLHEERPKSCRWYCGKEGCWLKVCLCFAWSYADFRFKSKLVTAHKISIDGVYEQRKGLPPPVEITVEKKMNKNVTIVHGLLNFGIDLNFFAAYCSKKFASTCNVQKIDISHV